MLKYFEVFWGLQLPMFQKNVRVSTCTCVMRVHRDRK